MCANYLYPENGGTSTLNSIVDRPDIIESCRRLVRNMDLRGIVGIDIMIDRRDNIGKVIEINVRPPHAVSIGFSGVSTLDCRLWKMCSAMRSHRCKLPIRTSASGYYRQMSFGLSPRRTASEGVRANSVSRRSKSRCSIGTTLCHGSDS